MSICGTHFADLIFKADDSFLKCALHILWNCCQFTLPQGSSKDNNITTLFFHSLMFLTHQTFQYTHYTYSNHQVTIFCRKIKLTSFFSRSWSYDDWNMYWTINFIVRWVGVCISASVTSKVPVRSRYIYTISKLFINFSIYFLTMYTDVFYIYLLIVSHRYFIYCTFTHQDGYRSSSLKLIYTNS